MVQFVDQAMPKNVKPEFIDSPMPKQQTQGTTFWENANAFGVGTAQGISDVGQRVALRPIESAMKSGIFDKPLWALRSWVAKWLSAITGKEYKVKEGAWSFSDYIKQWGGRWNIMTQEQQESWAGKFGRWVGQFIGTTALTAPIGWAVGWLAKAGQAWSVFGWLARWAAAGGITGWAGAQIWALGTQDRFATAKETAIWAALWGVVWWVAWAKAAGKWNKLTKMITEKGTSKNIEKAAQEGRVKFSRGILSKEGKITPSERVANGRDVIAREIKWYSTKNPQKLVKQIDKLWQQKYTELSSDLNKIKVGTMTKAKAALKSQIKEVKWLTDEFTNADIKKLNSLSKSIDNAKTADDLWKARVAWDKIFSQTQKQGSQATGQTGKAYKLWKSVRDTMNNNLDEIVSKQWGPNVKSKFFDMSSLLESKDNLIKNIPSLAKKAPTKLGKAAKAVWYGTAGAYLLSKAKNLWQ